MFKEVIDAVVRKYGFENEVTIKFCAICEKVEESIDENILFVYKVFCMLMEGDYDYAKLL